VAQSSVEPPNSPGLLVAGRASQCGSGAWRNVWDIVYGIDEMNAGIELNSA